MEKCDAHEQQTKDCAVALDSTKRHEDTIKKLFLRIDGISEGMQTIHSGQAETQLMIMNAMERVEAYHKEVCDFQALAKRLDDEVKAFNWFREPLNKLQKRLPWFVITLIMLALVSFALSYESMSKIAQIAKKIFGWL